MKRFAVAATALLTVFHAWVFGSQVWDGQLADPGLLLRWLVAAGVVGGIAVLRRDGAPLFWGRKAVAVWLLAALLHGPAIADSGFTVPGQLSLPEAVATVLQVFTASSLFALGLAMAAAGARHMAALRFSRAVAALPARSTRHTLRTPRAPRPPPQFA